MISRRALLTLSASASVAALAACTAGQQAIVSKVTSDASVIADGISAILPVVQGVVGISAGTVAAVQGAVAKVKAAASVLENAVGSTAQTAASELSAGVAVVNAATTGLQLPGWVPAALQAAQTLLPIVLSLAGVALGGTMPTEAAVANARATLQFAATQR